MFYFITKKNAKQSVQNLAEHLKSKNIDIPRSVLLEGFAKAMFFKNWNTLEGLSTKPNIIEHYTNRITYMVEIDCSANKDEMLKLINRCLTDAKCDVQLTNYLYDNNAFHFELSFKRREDNFLTAMFLLAQELKSFQVTRFEQLRVVFEKESLIDAIKLDFPKKIVKN